MGISNKGQSLVEFAISLVVLLFLLVGLVEFGIIFFQFVQLRDAVQEGALFGSACPDPAQIELRVRGSSNTPLDLSSPDIYVSISVTDPAGNPKDLSAVAEGDGLKVEAVYLHKVFMPFLPKLIGRNTIPLHATVVDTVLKTSCP